MGAVTTGHSKSPRTENPDSIIRDIITGFENPDLENNTIESDRKKAIKLAIETAAKDDIVLIAGKGHETYQIIGKQKSHFSDKEIAREYLQSKV